MIKIINTLFKEVKIIEPEIFNDKRGYFLESYNQKDFNKHLGNINFIQDNESYSNYGILRGLHYQEAPYEQSKLVRVIKGEIQDIVVDLRKESKTYLKCFTCILNDRNKKQILIPKGFAHGFLVLSKNAIVNYKVDNFYAPDYEVSIPFDYPRLKLKLKLNYKEIIVSKKDSVLSKNYEL